MTPITRFRDELGAAADRFLGPSQWEPGIMTVPEYGASSEEVMGRLSTRSPEGVDYPMAQAYAAGLVAQRCVEAAGSLRQSELRQAAGRLDFTTFHGRYRIDPDTGRQLGHVMPVVRWEGGQKRVVWPVAMQPPGRESRGFGHR